ncbi:MAG: hypothetical protein ACTHNU_16005 [Gaiellales bacterium]
MSRSQSARARDGRRARPLHPALLAGFALACIGGPLALVVLLGPDAVGGPAIGSAGLTSLLGVAAFVPPLLVWWRFGERIAGSGGLYGYVREAAGPRIALAQAAVWTFSYFLYLPSTVVQLTYDVLPVGFPGLLPYRGWILAVAPVVMVAAVVLLERAVIAAMAVGAVAQIALVIAFATVVGRGAALHGSAFTHAGSSQIPRGAGNIALFFVCASLPLYLGAEVAGGGRALRRTVAAAVAVAAVLVVGGLAVYSGLAGSAVATLPVPGYTLAGIYGSSQFANVLLAGVAVSVTSVILAEYIALTRLANAVTGMPAGRAAVAIGGVFIAASLLSLLDPERLYGHLLSASLIALYLSQILVFVGYPIWRRALGRLSMVDIAATVLATGLMGFGLYVAVTQAST